MSITGADTRTAEPSLWRAALAMATFSAPTQIVVSAALDSVRRDAVLVPGCVGERTAEVQTRRTGNIVINGEQFSRTLRPEHVAARKQMNIAFRVYRHTEEEVARARWAVC